MVDLSEATRAHGALMSQVRGDDSVVARPEKVELDPNNPFELVLIKMVETHRKKSADYAGTGSGVNPNQNFYDVGYQLSHTAGESCENLIAVKQARLRVLLGQMWKDMESRGMKSSGPQNESIDDTLLDRAVYAVIALTLWNEGGYHNKAGFVS